MNDVKVRKKMALQGGKKSPVLPRDLQQHWLGVMRAQHAILGQPGVPDFVGMPLAHAYQQTVHAPARATELDHRRPLFARPRFAESAAPSALPMHGRYHV